MARPLSTSNSPPQHYQLLRAFRQLKDQEFPHLSRELVELCRMAAPAAALASNQAEIAWIRSILSHRVRELLAPREPWMTLAEWRSLLFAWFHALLSASLLEKTDCQLRAQGQVSDLMLARSVGAELKHNLKARAGAAFELAFLQRQKQIVDEVEATLPRALRLLRDLARTSPPGRLVFPQPGNKLSLEAHQPLNGHATQGLIVLALFPAYAVELPGAGRDLAEKSLVFTGEESNQPPPDWVPSQRDRLARREVVAAPVAAPGCWQRFWRRLFGN